MNNFIHNGETEINKICLNDCLQEYPYYIINEISERYIYECINVCDGYFVPNKDSNIIAKHCIDSSSWIDDKYKIEETINNVLIKKCYDICPTEAEYQFNSGFDHTCYEEYLENTSYHKKEETICCKLYELNGGFLLYNEKELTNNIVECPSKYKYKNKEINSVIISLNECISNDLGGKYLTPYNTCAVTCPSNDPNSLGFNKNLINDEKNKKCIYII